MKLIVWWTPLGGAAKKAEAKDNFRSHELPQFVRQF